MKKTQFIDVIKDIKKNIVSVISVIVFVSLSVGVFFGITWFINNLEDSYDAYVDEGKVAAVSYYFAYGADDTDIEKLSKTSGVDEVDGVYLAYGNIDTDDGSKLAEIRTCSSKINQIVLKEGKLPEKDNEIAINEYAAESYNIQVGDVIDIKQKDTTSYYLINRLKNYSDLEEVASLEDEMYENHYALKENTFTVTGIVQPYSQTISYDRPYYYAELSKTSISFYVSEEAFDLDNVTGYNYVYIYNKELADLEILSDEYDEAVASFVDTLKPTVEEINENGYMSAKEKSDLLLSDYCEKLDEALEQINDGKKQLEEARAQYNAYLKTLDASEKQLAAGKIQLDEGKLQLAEAEEKLEAAYSSLASYQQQYDSAKSLADDVTKRYGLLTSEAYLNTNPDDDTVSGKDLFNNLTDLICSTMNASTDEDTKANLNTLFSSAEEPVKTYKTITDDKNIRQLISNLVVLKKEGSWGNDNATDIENTGNYLRGAVVLAYHENLIGIYDDLNSLSDITGETYFDFDLHQIDEYIEIIKNYIVNNGVIAPVYSNPTDLDDSFVDEVRIIQKYVKDNGYDSKISDAWKLLEDKNRELQSGWNTYYSGKSQYDEKEALYCTSLQKYNDGLSSLASGRKQLKTALAKIEDGEEELSYEEEEYQTAINNYTELEETMNTVEKTSYVCLYKANSTSVTSINTMMNVSLKSRNSFVSLFFVIALLICYNVMTRMISASVTEIGTKKALGFRKSEIFMHYLLVITIVLLIGFLLSFICSLGIQLIMSFALKNFLLFPLDNLYISVTQILLMLLIYFAVFGIITFISCNTIVNRSAISLLNNTDVSSKKKHLYEKTKMWKRLPLISKTTINNCFDDRKRVLSTIVGIASCVVLLISAITVSDNVRKSFDLQFTEYFHFDTIAHIDFDDYGTEETDELLKENGLEALKLYVSSYRLECGDKLYAGDMFVYPSDEDISNYFSFVSTGDKEYDGKGIWLQRSANEYLNIEAGDTVSITKISGETINGEIAGFIEGHVPAMSLYMDSGTYEELTGEKFSPNTIFFDSKDYTELELDEMFSGLKGYNYLTFYKEVIDEAADVYVMLTGAVGLVYFAASLVLGFFVILNMLFTLVEQRHKEVVVLMINGYSYKQAKKYIYTDTIYLTVISVVFGIIIGNLVGVFLIKQLEDVYIVFIHSYDIFANIVSIAMTTVLVYLMARIALKKVDHFRLTDLNK